MLTEKDAAVLVMAGTRKDYWSHYHERRQNSDPQYRARKRAAALKHKEHKRGISQ